MNPILPPKIQPGDQIAIISPSQSPVLTSAEEKQFHTGCKYLENRNFKVKLGKCATGRYHYSAGTPQDRLDDIHEMFADKGVKAIFASIGGETANELLPGLDFDLIKANPKIFVGVSDVSTLLMPITNKTGLVTYYGPDVCYAFGAAQNKKVESQTWECLSGGKWRVEPAGELTDTNGVKVPAGWKCIREGKARGMLFGGYLDIVKDLYPTKFGGSLKGRILFLEGMENSAIIHLRLQYMKIMGIFDEIAGLILGYFPDIKTEANWYREIGDILLELTAENDFPILQVNELGHCIDNYVWPIGIEVEMDAGGKTIRSVEQE